MLVQNARILVVDDNPATLYSTSHVLRRAGWEVEEASTGAEAVAKAQNSIDLVVLDVNLPDFDGFEVCRRIRRIETAARIPVIHLSATFIRDMDKVHGFEVGADGYLTHPIEPPVLIATVRAFLRTRDAEIEREKLLISERAARAEAVEANRVKDEFLAVLSHELRTPLHAILGWSEVLKMLPPGAAETQEGVAAIERNAKALSQMIADLLDVSQITSGKLRLDIQSIDLASTIQTALATIGHSAQTKGVQIEESIHATTHSINADPHRIQQVVWNLLSNAIKFTPSGGKVKVVLEEDESDFILRVIDSGKGIEPALLPEVFERFRQGDATSSREFSGLGLGLALAKQFVELHGGTIEAKSEGEGQGAEFIVRLLKTAMPAPVPSQRGVLSAFAAIAKPSARPEAGDHPHRLVGETILVVDDEPDARNLMCKILSDYGASVRCVGSAAAALEAIAYSPPRLLISDLAMPHQDGLNLIQEVRTRGYSRTELPAIALSAFARVEDRQRALSAGYQAHLAKPIDFDELRRTIELLL